MKILNRYIKPSNGYWVLYYLDEDGNTHLEYEHRMVWSNYWKIEIPKGHVIHHIDKNKLNNHISNLYCLSNKDHTLHHSPHKQR